MRKSISLLALPVIAAAIAVPLVGASAATHEPRLTAGVEHLYIASTCANCNNSPIIFTGAFTDYGKTTGAANSPKGGAKLKKGTISVSLAGVKQTSFSDSAANCWFKYSAAGPIVITGGTGAYKGIKGTIKFSQTVVGIGARLSSGACNMANNAPDVATITTGSGSGRVRF
jgi:hypothetical protein